MFELLASATEIFMGVTVSLEEPSERSTCSFAHVTAPIKLQNEELQEPIPLFPILKSIVM
jgi:hypothetical protein